jgi:protocatechuate 3,4-dioxygenase beta subunit
MVVGLSPRTGDFNSTAFSTLTDDEGRFVHETVPIGSNQLQIRGEGPIENVPIEPGEDPLLDLVIELDTGCILYGVVLGAYGEPLADASVSVNAGDWAEDENRESDLDGVRLQSTRTDAEGRFELYDLIISEDFRSITVSASADWYVRGEQELRAPDSPQRYGPVELQLVRSGAIEGTVSDGYGSAVEGAVVRVRWQMTTRHLEDGPDALMARSRSDGTYRIGGVPPGRFMVSAVEGGSLPMFLFDPAPKVGASESWFIDVPVAEGETTRLDIQLAAEAVVGGRVTDTVGNPVAGVQIELRRLVRWPAPDMQGSVISSIGTPDGPVVAHTGPDEHGVMRTEFSRRERIATTDVNGEYRMQGVTLGDKQLVGVGIGENWLTPKEREFSVSAPTEVHADKDFIVGAGLTLAGRIVDELGLSVGGAYVVVQPLGASTWVLEHAARSDEDGRFAVNGLPDEKLRMWIYKPGYRNHWDELRPGGQPLDIVLVAAMQIRGIVYDASTREPVTEYDLTTSLPNATMGMSVHDEGGKFATNADDDGPYEVVIEAVGYEQVVIPAVHPADTMQTPLIIYLRRL